MPLPLQSAVDTLWRATKSAGGVAVTYTQDGTDYSLYAVPGTTVIESQNNDGSIRTEKVQDFIFQVSDMSITPQRADTITWGTRTFEVVQPDGERCYSYSDQFQRLIRVSTKEVYGS
jgi:hypothetical protein